MKKLKEPKSMYASGYRPADLEYFEPLQINIRDNFDESVRTFKSVVQKEKILSLYKEKQSYEKPSVKARRKSREAQERRLAAENKQKLVNSGEWEKRMKKRQAKRQKTKENGPVNNG